MAPAPTVRTSLPISPAEHGRIIQRLDDLGIMINGSFVFGLDGDDEEVFARTVEWATRSGLTTATFHILTPYPGTALFSKMAAQERIVTRNWDSYDTRHVVYQPRGLSSEQLKRGYDWSYEAFYRWSSIFQAASAHQATKHKLKHFFYSAGWKKFERAWNLLIRLKQLSQMRPVLEAVLSPVDPRRWKRAGRAAQHANGADSPPTLANPTLRCHLEPSAARARCHQAGAQLIGEPYVSVVRALVWILCLD